MGSLLHSHPGHRRRQIRWLIPLGILLGAILVALATQYVIGSHDVQAEFFRAHKTIHNTSQLLNRGMWAGAALLVVGGLVIGWWVLRMTHRIVRPIHVLHQALAELAGGNLGVRVRLHRRDEFQEVGETLNALATELGATLARSRALGDQILELAERALADPDDGAARALLHERAHELDRVLESFRLTPEHVIGDEG